MKELVANFSKGSENRISEFFDFWRMEVGDTITVRFLPDLNEENPMGFILKDHYHFIEGKRVPCTGQGCTYCAKAQEFFKLERSDPENSKKHHDDAMTYYHKIQYLGQVAIIDAGSVQFNKENKVHIISLGPKLFKVIVGAMQSGDLENDPSDINVGYNFRIRKTKNGLYADYSTSSFTPKPLKLPNGQEILKHIKDLSNYKI